MNFYVPDLTADSPEGALCQVRVADLKPTQNAVGFDEVNDKITRYSAKSKGRFETTFWCTRYRSSSATAANST